MLSGLENRDVRHWTNRVALAAAIATGAAGCGTTSPDLQIQEYEREATTYQRQGSPELARLYQDRADRLRAEEKRKDHGVLETLVDALFSISIDSPAPAKAKK